MRIEATLSLPLVIGDEVSYAFESEGDPANVLRYITSVTRMCVDDAKRINRNIKAFEHRERNRAST